MSFDLSIQHASHYSEASERELVKELETLSSRNVDAQAQVSIEERDGAASPNVIKTQDGDGHSPTPIGPHAKPNSKSQMQASDKQQEAITETTVHRVDSSMTPLNHILYVPRGKPIISAQKYVASNLIEMNNFSSIYGQSEDSFRKNSAILKNNLRRGRQNASLHTNLVGNDDPSIFNNPVIKERH